MADTVDIAVRWSEAGQNIPTQTAAHLQNLKGAAAGASAELGDRMTQAFTRLEQREPTMVLRRARFALEEMAASTIGAQGQVGRLVASFGMLAPQGFFVVGAITALGAGIKALIDSSSQLEERLSNINREFATLGGAGATAFVRIAEIDKRLSEARDTSPGFVDRLKIAAFTLATLGTSDAASVQFIQGKSSEAATLSMMEDRVMADRNRQHAETLRRHTEQAQRQLRERVAEQVTMLGALRLDRAPFRLGPPSGVLGGGESLPQLQPFAFGGEGSAFLAAHESLSRFFAPDQTLRLHGALTDRPVGNERAELQADQRAERNAERMALVIGRELGPAISAFSGGGARGAVAGLGGITSALASLNDPKTGMALLGPAAPWLGLASGVLSGISSLFGGGQKPKVTITSYEQQALDQMKSVLGLPLTTQIIVVGAGDIRNVQQALNTLQRLGVTTRLPR